MTAITACARPRRENHASHNRGRQERRPLCRQFRAGAGTETALGKRQEVQPANQPVHPARQVARSKARQKSWRRGSTGRDPGRHLRWSERRRHWRTVGAGAGTGVSATGRGQQIVQRPETVLTFELESTPSVVPTTQSPHHTRSEQRASGTAAAGNNPAVAEDGLPVLKRRSQ